MTVTTGERTPRFIQAGTPDGPGKGWSGVGGVGGRRNESKTIVHLLWFSVVCKRQHVS